MEDTQRRSSPVPRDHFGFGRIRERRATGFVLGQLGRGWWPRGCAQEQGKERSLRGAVRAPETAVQLPGAQVKRSITVA